MKSRDRNFHLKPRRLKFPVGRKFPCITTTTCKNFPKVWSREKDCSFLIPVLDLTWCAVPHLSSRLQGNASVIEKRGSKRNL
ncbi:hypothetical protein JTE90_001198 [Oedothorax gibbosus]|uniref:Uncharacterized protein n=1 Tax=Oedothorax gibbosus TaxID=931172 RepID=A0AAV6UVJ5_9ARAC|nr:hypothetical protein JTE90_001198 [Oedothorax gibbosus]